MATPAILDRFQDRSVTVIDGDPHGVLNRPIPVVSSGQGKRTFAVQQSGEVFCRKHRMSMYRPLERIEAGGR